MNTTTKFKIVLITTHLIQQYLLWFISLSLSLAGSFTLCLSACYLNRPKEYTWDKWIGSLVVLPVFVSIITAMTFDSFEPWTNGLLKLDRSPSAFVKSCSIFNASRDKFHPFLYQRYVRVIIKGPSYCILIVRVDVY